MDIPKSSVTNVVVITTTDSDELDYAETILSSESQAAAHEELRENLSSRRREALVEASQRAARRAYTRGLKNAR